MLLHKGPGKPLEDPASFRPLCMLKTAGKTLERLLLARLREHVDTSATPLSDMQFGFRVGRATEEAISTGLGIARSAAVGAWSDRDLCAMVCLDVSNNLNTAPWRQIDQALGKKNTPAYLKTFLRSYLQNRQVIVSQGVKLSVTCGVSQGSVIDPML